MPIPIPETTARRAGERRVTSVRNAPQERGGQASRNTRTREAILTAALSLYAAEGYGAVTMRGIAQRLGFSAPAIYNYFLSKEEIFATLQEIGLNLLAETVLGPESPDPVADLRSVFVNYYEFSKAQPEYFALLFVDPAAPRVHYEAEAMVRMMTATLRRWQRCADAGLFPAGTSDASGLFWAAVHGPAVLRRVQVMSPDTNFDAQVMVGLDLAIAGIRAGLLPPDAFGRPLA